MSRRLLHPIRTVLVATFVVVHAGCFGGRTGLEVADPPPLSDRVVFYSTRDGSPQVYIMNQDGSGQTRLTSPPGDNTFPVLSRDGSTIAFVSSRDGNSEIYVMNADGTSQRRLTNDPASDRDPSINSDGSMVAFVSERDGNEEIYVVRSDASGLARLTTNPGPDQGPFISRFPSVGISYCSGRGEAYYIYTMGYDGSRPTQMPGYATTRDCQGAAVSPDGDQVVYASYDGGVFGNMDVFVQNLDGSGRRNLTRHRSIDLRPIFSVLGNRVIFVSYGLNDVYNYEVWDMNVDGSDLRNLTNHPEGDAF